MYVPWEWIREKTKCGDNFPIGKFIEQLNYHGLECEKDFTNEVLFINFITAQNRKDLKSWWGLAREISILLDLGKDTDLSSQKKQRNSWPEHPTSNLQFVFSSRVIEYSMISLHNFFKSKELPIWMSQSLVKNGLGNTNGITAIASFVTLETGQSFHLFDLEKLQNISSGKQIIIREAGANEAFTDNLQKERKLTPGSLLVETNGKIIKPPVVNGESSIAIDQMTKDLLAANIYLSTSTGEFCDEPLKNREESRVFINRNSEEVVRRFEEITREFYVYQENKTKYYSFPQNKKELACRKLEISMDFLERKIGVFIPQQEIETILNRLNFPFKSGNKHWVVKIPTFRSDIAIKEDLLEEIGKLLDYNLLPESLPSFQNQFINLQFNNFYKLKRRLALYLLSSGYQEVLSYSLIENLHNEDSKILLANPRSSSHIVYRNSFIASHLKIIKHNQGQGRENLFLFEIGDIYSKKSSSPSPVREQVLAVTAIGKIVNLQTHRFTEQIDIYWMKGLLENLLLLMDIDEFRIGKGEFTSSMDPNYPLIINREEVGFIRQCSSETLLQKKVKNAPCFVLQLSFSKLLPFLNKQEDKKYTPVSYLPVITKNISFFIEKNIPLEQIVELIKGKGGGVLLDVSLVDIYPREKQSSSHSLNFQLLFQGKDTNLQNSEVEVKIEAIWEALLRKFSVLRR